MLPTPVFWPGEFHGLYSLWGHKESDTTERLSHFLIDVFVLQCHPMVASNTTFNLAAAAAKSLQLCPTLCNPIDGSPPGSPVPGILQARILEWVAISFSIKP